MVASTLFLVRIWRQPDRPGRGSFHASVRAVDAEREALFTRPADLVRYLARTSAAGEAPSCPTPCSPTAARGPRRPPP